MIPDQTTHTFAAVYQFTDSWWVGWLTDLPGANGQGRTLEEARASLRAAAAALVELGEVPTQAAGDHGDAVRPRLS